MDNFTTNFSLNPFETSNGSTTVAVPDVNDHYYQVGNGTASWDFSLMNAKNLKYSKGWTATLATAYSIIFLLGFVGNVIVILVISLKPRMRTVTNLFILNLAVADLLVVLFCVPVTLVANLFIPWIFGTVICKVMAYAQGVSVSASVYSLVAISADRCRALYRPIGKPHGFTNTQAKLIILLIWVIASLITSPWLVVFNVSFARFEDGLDVKYYPYCQENWSYNLLGKVYFIGAHLILCFLFPFLVISLVNLVIWLNVQKFRKVSQEQDVPMRYNINGVTKLLCIITITFIVSWLPLYALMAKIKLLAGDPDEDAENAILAEPKENGGQVNGEEEESGFVDVLVPFAQLLGSSNSCVNPLLYAFHSRMFRAAILSFCRR